MCGRKGCYDSAQRDRADAEAPHSGQHIYKGIQSDSADHCVLFIDEDSGDGILVQAEGYGYARYSQFVPDARGLMETVDMTETEKKIHGYLREITDKIAELSHRGEKSHCFSDLIEKMDMDFDTLLQQAVVEMLQERANIQMAEHMPIDIDFQPDLIARLQETHKLRLITPLKILVHSDEGGAEEFMHPKLAVYCRYEIVWRTICIRFRPERWEQ